MAILTESWAFDAAIALITIFWSIYLFFQYSFKFWSKLKIPHTKPKFPLGDFGMGGLSLNPVETLGNIYNSNRGEKIIGSWEAYLPVLIVRDLDIVKDMLLKNFKSFHDRGLYVNEKEDPLTGNLFSLDGSKWKNLRAQFSPAFTSNKIKKMFHVFVNHGARLIDVINEYPNQTKIEMKKLLDGLTTDVIFEIAFGIELETLKNPDSIFRQMGKNVLAPSFLNMIKSFLIFNPRLIKSINLGFNVKLIDRDITEFFVNSVREMMEYREQNNIYRDDFLQILIQLKNKGELGNVHEDNGNKTTEKFTVEQAAAQAFLFFFAGFETSSTVIQFSLYEMALNPDLQEKAREEINTVIKKYNGEITYEAIQEMEYLGRLVDESLRKYPPTSFLIRSCTKKYRIPDTEWVIPQGTKIIVPVVSIHRDPDYYPDPEQFDPDRFTEDNKSTRHNYAFLPFGDGLRTCIGKKLGVMQSKMGIVSLLLNFKFEICDMSPVPMKLKGRNGILTCNEGMVLKVSKLGTRVQKC